MSLNFSKDEKRIGKLLGIRKFDSQKDMKQINEARTAAQALGIRNLDSQNDVRQIRDYLKANPGQNPGKDPSSIIEEDVRVNPGSEEQEPEPFNYNDALSEMSANFAAQISAQEAEYAQTLQGLEDRLKQLQNRPSANPSERNRVMGVRFAGQNNRLRRAGNIFKRDGGRIRGIRSNAINI